MIHCPYCGGDDLDWTRFTDTVKWYEEDGGVIYTSGLRCRDPACKGSKGFTAELGFTVGDEVTYTDEDGEEIAGDEDASPSP